MNQNLFRSSRIQLKALKKEDAEAMARWSEDSEYLRNLDTDFAVPRSAEHYRSEIESISSQDNTIELGIHLISENQLIGFISLNSIEWNNRSGRLAVGIGESKFRHLGIGTEAVKMMIHYAFDELNLNRVGLDVISSNQAAIRCYQKSGFVVEGTIRESILRDGKKMDRIYMGLLRNEWVE